MNLLLLHKYPCVVLAFALTCAVVFVFGSWQFGFSDVVLWGSLVVLLSIGFFPPQNKYESYASAQRDTLRGLFRDPVLYLCALLLAYMATQAWNSGRPVVYDVVAGRWAYGALPLPGMPGSVNSRAVWRMFFAFLPAFAVLLCARHGMTPSGRRAYLTLLVLFSALLAVWECWVFIWLNGETDGWRVFSNADHGGIWFFLCFCIAFVMWGYGCARKYPNWLCHVFLLCALLHLAGIMVMRAPTALLLAWCAGLPLAAATLAVVWTSLDWTRRVVAMVVFSGLLVFALFLFFHNGLGSLGLGVSTAEPFGGQGVKLGVVWKMALEHPMYGVGAGNYPFFSEFYWPAGQIEQFVREGLVANNDYMQMFAEFGIVGLLIMLALAAFFVSSARRHWIGAPPACKRLFVVFLAGVGLVFLAAWVGSPFRSPPALVSVVAALACASGFLSDSHHEDDVI